MSITDPETSVRHDALVGAYDGQPTDGAAPTASRNAASNAQVDWAEFDQILEPHAGWRAVDFRELLAHRDLFAFWTLRGLKARHAQSALGIGWAVVQPVVNTVIFAVVFGRLVGVDSGGVPYPLFALVGMVIWTFFSNGLRDGVESLTRYTNMLSKIYFPRLILPVSAVAGKLLDLGIGGLLVVPAMMWYGVVPRLESIVVIPVMLLMLLLATVGLALWFSALAVQYRDIQHAMVFALQAIMYLSPVVYSDRVVPWPYRLLYGLNPVAGVIAGARAALLGSAKFPWDLVLVSSLSSVVLVTSGLYYFRSRERVFADVA